MISNFKLFVDKVSIHEDKKYFYKILNFTIKYKSKKIIKMSKDWWGNIQPSR